MLKWLYRLYWNSKIVGDDEFGYSASRGERSCWAASRETLLFSLVEHGLPNR